MMTVLVFEKTLDEVVDAAVKWATSFRFCDGGRMPPLRALAHSGDLCHGKFWGSAKSATPDAVG